MENFDLYFQLWDLCKTIRKGIDYCKKHSDNTQVSKDVLDGLQTVEPFLKNRMPNLLRMFSEKSLSSDSFLKTVAIEVVTRFNEQMQGCTYLGKDESEKMFLMWEEIPHGDGIFYQWIFDVCLKSSVFLPEKSFKYMIKLLEEQPRALSGETLPHPGYEYRPSEQHTFEKCPICGGCGTPYFCSFAYQMSDFEYPHLPVKLWMNCGSCGNLYTWQYPKALLALSDHTEMIYPKSNQRLTSIENTNGAILAIWSDILHELRAYTTGDTLLEVGVGKGELLAVAQEMGFESDGVEIVKDVAQKVSDMLDTPIWCGDFLKYHPDKTYSIIIMGDVIEHVTSPEKALRNAHRLLKEDGVLWLSTPNFESSFSRMRKFSDAMWMEPYHISYFSKSGLTELAARCGFTVQKYSVSRRYNGSMELILTKR